MKIELRHIVAVCLLLFAWKGHVLDMEWPPLPGVVVSPPSPSPERMAWAADVRGIAPRMLPADREYLSSFYEGLAFVLLRDKDRTGGPIIRTTDEFATFHGGSLEAAIDKAKVGIYPGLDKAIDKVFFAALDTDEPKKLTDAERESIVAACGVLSYTFKIGRDG